MPNPIPCPHCGASLELPPHAAGMDGTCPLCQGGFTIPGLPRPCLPPPKPKETEAEFHGCCFGMLCILILIIVLGIIGSLTGGNSTGRDPAAIKRAESWRQQKLKDERDKNYVEHIRPYVPRSKESP